MQDSTVCLRNASKMGPNIQFLLFQVQVLYFWFWFWFWFGSTRTRNTVLETVKHEYSNRYYSDLTL